MADAAKRQQSLNDQFSDVQHFDVPVFSRMSIEQLVEYRAAVMNVLEETRQVKLWNAYALGVTDVLLHFDPHADAQTLRQMVLKAEFEERDAHPDDFDAMARQIEAQDAPRDKVAKKASAEGVNPPQPKHAAPS